MISKKVQGRLDLLNIVSNKLELLSQREIISIGQMLHEGQRDSALNLEDFDSFTDPPLTYSQLEERISLSIELLKGVRPVQRQDDLSSLADILEKRIESDKLVQYTLVSRTQLVQYTLLSRTQLIQYTLLSRTQLISNLVNNTLFRSPNKDF